MNKLPRYASFLVRLWRTDAPEQIGTTVWLCVVEHIQSGEDQPVERLRDLPAVLRRLTVPDESVKVEDVDDE